MSLEPLDTLPAAANAPAPAGTGAAAAVGGIWRNASVQRLVTWGALLIAWEVFARSVGPFFFPSLPSVGAGLWEVVTGDALVLLANSLRQMLLGFALAVVVGVPLGLLIGSSRIAEWTLGPYVNALFVTSLSALLPFLILLFGVDLPFRVSVVFLFAVFYLIINPAAGVRAIDPGLTEMSTAFGAGRLKRFFALTLPGTLPYIIAGLRLGLGQAVQGMIIAELWVSVDTGRRLSALADSRQLGEFFALTLVIVLVGTVLTSLLLIAQRRLSPWASHAQAEVGAAR